MLISNDRIGPKPPKFKPFSVLKRILRFFWRTSGIGLLLKYPGKTEWMAQRQAGGGGLKPPFLCLHSN
jgi:hypothetical protein